MAVSANNAWRWGEDHQGPLTVDDDFASLDDNVEQSAFTQLADVTLPDGSTRQQACSVLVVQGMYCAACADAVTAAVQRVQCVEGVELNDATTRVTLYACRGGTTVTAWASGFGAQRRRPHRAPVTPSRP